MRHLDSFSLKKILHQNKPRGAAAAVFVFLWGEVRILAEKEFNAPQAADLRDEINPPQAEQY